MSIPPLVTSIAWRTHCPFSNDATRYVGLFAMKIIVLTATLLTTATAFPQEQTQTVLFVCEHGVAKSVVAAAQFNQLALERGLPFRAISRGTAPEPSVPLPIIEGLRTEGLTVPAGFSPSLVTTRDVRTSVRVVTFDVSLPIDADTARVSRWDSLPAFSDGYRQASEAIRGRVRGLLQALESSAKQKKMPRPIVLHPCSAR